MRPYSPESGKVSWRREGGENPWLSGVVTRKGVPDARGRRVTDSAGRLGPIAAFVIVLATCSLPVRGQESLHSSTILEEGKPEATPAQGGEIDSGEPEIAHPFFTHMGVPEAVGVFNVRLRVTVLVSIAVAAIGGAFLAINLHLFNAGSHPWLIPASGFDEGIDLDSVLPAIQIVIAAVSIIFLRRLRRDSLARTTSKRA